MPVLEVNGVTLHYRELGRPSKRPMVFTHPLLFGTDVFDDLVSEFADDYRLILVDLHGHGASGYRAGMTLDAMTEDYYALMTRLNIADVIWVGFSIGGMIGLRLALAHAETIGALVLIATTARLDPPHIREQTWKLWELFRDGHREDVVDLALPFFFSPETYKTSPDIVERYRRKIMACEQVDGMFEAARAAYGRNDISGLLPAIRVPTLAVAGKDDPMQSPAESERIVARMPQAQSVTIDDASHLLVVERPGAVAQTIRAFLDAGR